MDLIQQKLNPGFYRNYLIFRELLDGNLDRYCRCLRHNLFRASNRRRLIIVFLILAPPLWRRHRLISSLFLFFSVLIILKSIRVVLCWLFVVGVDQVQLFDIESKLRGRLMHILLTPIRQLLWLN